MTIQIRLGFVPLTDSAPLIIAQELGYFKQFGLDVTLCPQNSWSTLRDKLQTGLLDAAQLLAPMPLASSLGLGGMKVEMTVPMVLSQNGNAISISRELHEEILLCNDMSELPFPMPSSLLEKVVQKRADRKQKKLRFATVFPYSCHQYQLLDWLKLGNVDAAIEVLIIPPSEMVNGLEFGIIDGFCVGGPWNAKSVREGTGTTVLTSYDIWQDKAEKVLGTTAAFYHQEPELMAKICAGLLLACEWLQHLPNRFEAARIMSQSAYLNEPIDVIAPSLLGSCLTQKGQSPQHIEHYNRFFQSSFNAVNLPSSDLQTWLLNKMIQNKQVSAAQAEQFNAEEVAEKIANISCFNAALKLVNQSS